LPNKETKKPIARISATNIMKKIKKSLLSKLFSSLTIKKTKEPKSTDALTSEEPDSNYVGNFEKKEIDSHSESSNESTENPESENEVITSTPYVIKITNDLDITIENFSLFGLYEENDKYFDENGNLVKDGLTISSDVSEISYKKICQNFKTNAFKIGLIYIRSFTDNQILENFTFKYQNANGIFFGNKIIPTIDPYQQQTNIVAIKSGYIFDENTSIIYSKIHPKTTLYLYFYQTSEILNESENVNEQIAYFIANSKKPITRLQG
jgi:hypothetical protein